MVPEATEPTLTETLAQVRLSGVLGRVRLEDGLIVSIYVREGQICVLIARNHWEPSEEEGERVARDLGWKKYKLTRTPIPRKVGGLLLREATGPPGQRPALLPGARLALVNSILAVRRPDFDDTAWDVRSGAVKSLTDGELIEEYQWHQRRTRVTSDPVLRVAREATLLADENLTKWGLMELLRPQAAPPP